MPDPAAFLARARAVRERMAYPPALSAEIRDFCRPRDPRGWTLGIRDDANRDQVLATLAMMEAAYAFKPEERRRLEVLESIAHRLRTENAVLREQLEEMRKELAANLVGPTPQPAAPPEPAKPPVPQPRPLYEPDQPPRGRAKADKGLTLSPAARSIMDRRPPEPPEPGSFLSPEEEAELRRPMNP